MSSPPTPPSPSALTTELLNFPPSAPFPPHSLSLIRSLPFNTLCSDCSSPDTSWSSPYHGTLLCLTCSGRHRSLGVHVSFVRSLTMDDWSVRQVLGLLEGGNGQFKEYCRRQGVEGEIEDVYGRKAVRYYRESLKKHVDNILKKGLESYVFRVRTSPATSAKKSSSSTEKKKKTQNPTRPTSTVKTPPKLDDMTSKTFTVKYPPSTPLGLTLSSSSQNVEGGCYLTVSRVQPYSYSSDNGVLVGDGVVEIDGREVKGLEEVMRIVKGWKVTEGVVRFRREEKVEEFNIVSREVEVERVKTPTANDVINASEKIEDYTPTSKKTPEPPPPPPPPQQMYIKQPVKEDSKRLYSAKFPEGVPMGLSLEKRPDGSAVVIKVIHNSVAYHGGVSVGSVVKGVGGREGSGMGGGGRRMSGGGNPGGGRGGEEERRQRAREESHRSGLNPQSSYNNNQAFNLGSSSTYNNPNPPPPVAAPPPPTNEIEKLGLSGPSRAGTSGGYSTKFNSAYGPSTSTSTLPSNAFSVTFSEKQLGLTLEEILGDKITPSYVKKIIEKGQAERLGVRVGDRVLKVKGREAVCHANVVAACRFWEEGLEVTFLREEKE
ncbi:hypothetical protein TrST_g485 [Triparma strigata]|uniref:PDZ domain-containing protein n=1 Tax=Triparma strigata TaxID=1606541 RepID=A0A9W7B747_9STRA|nr:hypothetical protein TrST_g485 [Triparma strigata]